jgi:hypothetical protein
MIQKAEQARTEAKAEYAEQFAPDDWAAAEKAWQEATGKLDAESYSEAYTLLLKAKTRYEKAQGLAKGKRAAEIDRITKGQETARIRLKRDLLDSADAKKLSAARKKQLDEQVKQIEDNIGKVSALLQNGQYTDASYLVGKATRDIYEVQQEYLKK